MSNVPGEDAMVRSIEKSTAASRDLQEEFAGVKLATQMQTDEMRRTNVRNARRFRAILLLIAVIIGFIISNRQVLNEARRSNELLLECTTPTPKGDDDAHECFNLQVEARQQFREDLTSDMRYIVCSVVDPDTTLTIQRGHDVHRVRCGDVIPGGHPGE